MALKNALIMQNDNGTTTTAIQIDTAITSNNVPVVINAAGNVGIGTSSPAYKLSVNGDISLTGNLFKSSSSTQVTIYVRANGSDANDGFARATDRAVQTLERAFDIANSLTDTIVTIAFWDNDGAITFGSARTLYNKTIIFKTFGITINWNARLDLHNTQLQFIGYGNELAGFPGTILLNTTTPFRCMSGFNTISAGGFYRTKFTANTDNVTFVTTAGLGNGSTGGAEFHMYLNFRWTVNNPNNYLNFRFAAPTEVNDTNRSQAFLHASSTGSFEMTPQSVWIRSGNHVNMFSDLEFNGTDRRIIQKSDSNLIIGTNNAERLRIDASGNVGIGTSAPQAKLQVVGTALISSQLTVGGLVVYGTGKNLLTLQASSNLLDRGISFRNSGGAYIAHINVVNAGSNLGDLVFGVSDATETDVNNVDERLRITSTGNVGIGTSTPSVKLDVVGISRALQIEAQAGSTTSYLSIAGTGDGLVGTKTNHALQLRTNNAERARIDASGNLLVGKTSTSGAVNGLTLNSVGQFIATSAFDAGIFYRKTTSAGNGVILTRSDIGGTNTLVGAGFANGTFGTVSDQRKKKNIVDARNYLDDLMQLRVVKYNWITDAEDTPKELGWIAQEVEQVFPGMITEMQGNKMLKKEVFMPMMLKAIQELSAKVDTLQAELNTLKGN